MLLIRIENNYTDVNFCFINLMTIYINFLAKLSLAGLGCQMFGYCHEFSDVE